MSTTTIGGARGTTRLRCSSGRSPRIFCAPFEEPAPPYAGEGPPALGHVGEDAGIERFEPRDGRVWAIDTRHLPLYWFPRDCPRATFWARERTRAEDVDRFLGGERTRRVHVVEAAWLER